MQPPMYNWTYLRSMKFAELGNAIGRAMIRGFYGEGSSHDVNGTSSAFELHCQCFINQYSNYSVKHHFLNGTATLEEHLEDNGGLNIALQAYNKWQDENTEYLLPFLNLTQQQLFFVRYAQTWCSSESESFLQEQLREGSHSPARFRVLGTLSNSPEFSQHFHCPLDSPMNPSRKCTLW
uniref:Peptidase M13 C-terminal domain-containing protein n=1 Tax=Eptatretus burgeri TaxID=7764 RepID=A0A8C4QTP2_EPTBU